MLTMIGLALKFAFSKVLSGIALAFKHWQVTLGILAILAIGAFGIKYRTISNERDYAIAKLDKYVETARIALEARQKENQAKEAYLIKQMNDAKAEHAAIILQLKGSYNEKIKHKDAAIANANTMRDSLRRKLEEAYAAARLSEGADRSIRFAEIRQDSDTAGTGQTDADYITSLEYACALTTADYNTLYDRCEAANRILAQ